MIHFAARCIDYSLALKGEKDKPSSKESMQFNLSHILSNSVHSAFGHKYCTKLAQHYVKLIHRWRRSNEQKAKLLFLL